MKRLKHIITAFIWTLASIYLVMLIGVNIPAIQSFLGSRTAMMLSKKLGTQVHIGRVSLGLLNRIIIDDVTIFDQHGKRMLYANRLSAKLDPLELPHKIISITSAQLFGMKARLYKNSQTAQPNFQFVIDSLAPKDTAKHSSLAFQIHSIVIRRGSVMYDQLDKPLSKTFNMHHLKADHISLHAIISYKDQSTGLFLKRMSFRESCGLDVNTLKFHLAMDDSRATLKDFVLNTPSTSINIHHLNAFFSRKEKSIDIETLRYQGIISPSHISTRDAACFLPMLKPYNKYLTFNAIVNGNIRHIELKRLNTFIGDKINTKIPDIHLKADIDAFFRTKSPSWNANIRKLSVNKPALEIASGKLPSFLSRFKQITFQGHAGGAGLNYVSLHGQFLSDAGNAQISFSRRMQAINAHVESALFDIGQITGNKKLKYISTRLSLQGNLHQKAFAAKGNVDRLDYNGYSYRNIILDGAYNQGNITGAVSIDDPNASIQLKTVKGIHPARGCYALTANIQKLTLSKLHLSENSMAQAEYSGHVNIDVQGKTLNSLTGLLEINDFHFKHKEREYNMQSLKLRAEATHDNHFLTLVSDFGHIEIAGNINYATLPQSIENIIAYRVPSLQPLTPFKYKPVSDNDFALEANITRDDWLRQLFGIDLVLSKPLVFLCNLKSKTQDFNASLKAPDLTYNGTHYSNVDVIATTPEKLLDIQAKATRIGSNGIGNDYLFRASTQENKIAAYLEFDNHAKSHRAKGNLNTDVHFDRNSQGDVMAIVSLKKSKLCIGDSIFNVHASNINYSKGQLKIDGLYIGSTSQYITVNGLGTNNPQDMLTIDIHHVDVSYLQNLLNFHSVDFNGFATGKGYVANLLSKPSVHADLQVDSFKFENGYLGTLYAQAAWNNEQKQIDINAHVDDTLHTTSGIKPRLTKITGYVSPGKNDLALDFDAHNTRGSFIEGLCSSFMEESSLSINGKLRLWGKLNALNLTGGIRANGHVKISPLNTTYWLNNDSVSFLVNEIQFPGARLSDRKGGTGYLQGKIFHNHLSKLSYDLDIKADKLLGYDWQEQDNSSIYGKVSGSGLVNIKGKPGNVDISVNVTPTKNSELVYDITNPDAIGSQEFISWVSRDSLALTDLHSMADNNDNEEQQNEPTDIHVNFLVHASPDATLKIITDKTTGDFIALNGSGTIQATYYNKGETTMFGTYTVDHGYYKMTLQNIIRRDFTFAQGGTITFGGAPGKAMLNLKALYTVNSANLADLQIGRSFAGNNIKVNCLMNINGTASDPRVDFDLDMPTVSADVKQMINSLIESEEEKKQQVLYLLAVGRFFNKADNGNMSNGTHESQTSLAMQSIVSGQLSQQINNVLSAVVKNKNWNFGANISTGTEGWNNAEYEGIFSGRLFNNRLIINTQFGYRDNAINANQSFIGDFDIRYLIIPNGNISVRVYNQANDKYFTRNSFNTQGVGFIFKKDFDSWRSLWGMKQKKQPSKKQKK